jgi:hypothetical protein
VVQSFKGLVAVLSLQVMAQAILRDQRQRRWNPQTKSAERGTGKSKTGYKGGEQGMPPRRD